MSDESMQTGFPLLIITLLAFFFYYTYISMKTYSEIDPTIFVVVLTLLSLGPISIRHIYRWRFQHTSPTFEPEPVQDEDPEHEEIEPVQDEKPDHEETELPIQDLRKEYDFPRYWPVDYDYRQTELEDKS